jgi:hypothetical protein
MLNRIARYLTTADDPKPLHDPHADFWREYLEYRRFWVWAWQTFPELADELARDLQAPDIPALEPLGGRCPCCNDANRPVGVWLSEDGRIVPATPRHSVSPRQSTD